MNSTDLKSIAPKVYLHHIVPVLFILFVSMQVRAQSNVVDYLQVGLPNARVLAPAYLEPLALLADNTLSTGYNHSPRVLRSGRFSVSYFYNQSFTNSGSELFNIAQLINSGALSDVTLTTGSPDNAPTTVFAFKEGQQRPTLLFNGNEVTAPNGDNISSLALPVVSASVGIPFNTELSVKMAPPIEHAELGDVLLYGGGIKHSIVPYLRWMQKKPFLESAVMVTYNAMQTSKSISYLGQTGQTLEMQSTALMARWILGAHFNVVDLFGSIAYGQRTSNIDLKGNFESIPGETAAVTDPVSHSFDFSGVEYEAGVQVRIYFVNLQASYVYSQFSAFSLGAGISF